MSFCLASLAEYPIRHPVLFLFLQSYRKYSPKYYGADSLYTPATLLTEKVSVTKVLPLCDRGSYYYLVP